MTRKTPMPATGRHILIYDTDWDFLERYFGLGAPRNRRVGCGYMCREYIHQGVQELRRRIDESQIMMDMTEGEDEDEEDFEDA